ncbi:MAG TPA: hypothetical protein VKA94_15395 [Hyphomicrobiales bacterium]|nr:hypothetical protein [Hyphomicrobiales bacterium]
MTASLSHINERGEANMVDVSGKAATFVYKIIEYVAGITDKAKR